MADEHVEAAIAHWGPRFVAGGVDFNDFRRVTAGLERWEDWLPAWVRNGDLHAELAREAQERGRTVSAGEAWNRAALSYHFAKFVWMLDAERYRDAAARAVEAQRRALELLDPSFERIEIPFEGTSMVGNLRRPPGVERPPLVLLLPGLDSTKEEFFHWAGVFLARGMATLALDGPGQGETGLSTTIHPDYEVAVTATLDHLEGRDEVDLGRVGCVGVSLGGYYAPRAIAHERRIAAACGISGPFDFGECWERLPALTRQTFVHHSGAGNDEEGRAKAGELNLREAARLIDRPLLALTGKLDRIIPWEQTKRIADEAPGGEFVVYEEGTHVASNVPYRYRPYVADWMRERL